jgi:phosphatidylglycerophosphate synthase
MLDNLLRTKLSPRLEPWTGRILQGGLTANRLTLIAFALGLAASFAAGMQVYALAFVLILLNRFLAGMAGAVARQVGETRLGGYLSGMLDILFFGIFVFLFSLGASNTALAAAFLLLTYLAMACVGASEEKRIEGLVGKTEITLFMLLCCVFPGAFAALAAMFGLVCIVAAMLRVFAAVKMLRQN